MTLGAGTSTDCYTIELRTEQDWDISHYMAVTYASSTYGVTKLPDIDHPETKYQRQYFYFFMGMGTLKEAEPSVWAIRQQMIFKDGSGSNVMFAEVKFNNDETNDEFDISMFCHSYINSTTGDAVAFSVPRTTKYIFIQLVLDYADANPDTLTLGCSASLLPYWPTGMPRCFHIASAIDPGDLEVKRLFVQKYMSDLDPGCVMFTSPPIICDVSIDTWLSNMVDYDFPTDLTDLGTLYYYGDSVEDGRRHLGPLESLPYADFEHQSLAGIRITSDATQTDIEAVKTVVDTLDAYNSDIWEETYGDSSEAAWADLNLRQKFRRVFDVIGDIFTGEFVTDRATDVLDILIAEDPGVETDGDTVADWLWLKLVEPKLPRTETALDDLVGD